MDSILVMTSTEKESSFNEHHAAKPPESVGAFRLFKKYVPNACGVQIDMSGIDASVTAY
jgi:hypothetical protein